MTKNKVSRNKRTDLLLKDEEQMKNLRKIIASKYDAVKDKNNPTRIALLNMSNKTYVRTSDIR